MATNNTSIEPRGNKQERNTFKEVHAHYTTSKQDLEQRMYRKNGFDDADKMFASHINASDWPYRSMIFDPRPYTAIVEKSARLIGSKPKGRLSPREGGDELGARINNELLNFQWDDDARLGEPMVAKWLRMDQQTRKYGASYALCKWRYETRVMDGKRKVYYDGPDFQVLNRRDVLVNPSYNFINKWFQHREWVTINELESINDAARTKPSYKNLDILRGALKEEARAKGDKRSSEYTLKNKSIRGFEDFMGSDEAFPVVEIITEYRCDRWITFTPKYGVIIRDIPNPYAHWEIPVVQLKYYPQDDDIDGVGEFEPVASQIRGINALMSSYIDTVSLALRPPVMINPTAVRMHTIEFTPEAKWLMNNPNVDAQMMKMDTSATSNFQSSYSVMVASLLNAWGETSQGISSIDPFQPDKTATEVRDTAFTRNVRDNMNQIFLAEALKKQMMFWHAMNQQFLFQGTEEQYKVIRVVGRDAVEFFEQHGLADMRPTAEDAEGMVMNGMNTGDIDMPMMEVPAGPRFAVDRGMGEEPKFQPDDYGTGGNLILEPGDLQGTYDYIPDIESMKAPSEQEVEQKLTAIIGTVTSPQIAQALAAEGIKPKVKELLVKAFEATNVIKDADAYFEELPPQPMMGQPMDVQQQANAGGNPQAAPGAPDEGAVGAAGMGGSPQAAIGPGSLPFMG